MKVKLYTKKYLSHILAGIFLILVFKVSAQAPVANFTVNATQGCAPFSVNFTNTSSGASTYQWTFGNGNFSVLTNPQNVYVQPGTYTVQLIAIAANGQRDTLIRTSYITAAPGPTPVFTQSALSGCAQTTSFSFTNNSQGATTYFWDFGDGNSSTQLNPVKTYATPGTYQVSLMATNSAGCSMVMQAPQTIQVNPRPVAGFSASPLVVCEPSIPIQFTSSSQGANSFLWEFGDGSTSTQMNPSKTYAASGVYTVKLRVTNAFGCTDSLIRNQYITVNEAPAIAVNATNYSGCTPVVTQLSTNITNAQSIQWNFGNGQTASIANPSVTYNTAGDYDITLTLTMPNGCVYTRTYEEFIEVYPLPQPAFTVTNNIGCAPLSPVFQNLTPGNCTYNWILGDATVINGQIPNHTYTTSGTFTVRLTATNEFGCTSFQQQGQIIQVQSPVAFIQANVTTGCPPTNVQFTSPTPNLTSWQWNFGDGTTSNLQNPSHLYTELGLYDVQLIVGNANGCYDTLLLEDYINISYSTPPYTTPPALNGCAPFPISFSFNGGNNLSYLWDFGDGTTSTLASPSHVYQQAGNYNVSLLLNNGTACQIFYPSFNTVQVDGEPPAFDVSIAPCAPHAVTFTDNSANSVAWNWNFGDGTFSTLQNPTHTYTDYSLQHVTLGVETANGCYYQFLGFNAVNFSQVSASFSTSYTPGPYPITVQFTNTTQGGSSFLWNFGDGNTSTEENPVHTFMEEGDYITTLIIDNDTCSSMGIGTPFEAPEEVNEDEGDGEGGTYPNYNNNNGEFLTGCAPLSVYFYKRDSTHTILSWNFGDGSTSIQQNPIHTYQQPGFYSVSYIANTENGLDTISYPQAILIGGGPIDFTLTSTTACSSTLVEVSPLGQSLAQIHWNFGDGAQSTEWNASHEYPITQGSQSIILTTIDSIGCIRTRSRSFFSVPPIPNVNYPTSVCRDTIQFTHNLGNSYSYLWEFGDGNSSTEEQPWHYYAVQGIYQVQVTVTDADGCSNTFQLPQSIRVAIPTPSFTINGPTEGCAPLQTQFMNTSGDNVAWFFTDNTFSPIANPQKIFPNAGVYGVTVRAMSTFIPGCTYQELFDSVITVHAAQAAFSVMQSGTCLPITGAFTDQSVNPVSWSWDFGNGITSTEQHPEIVFTLEPAALTLLSIVDSNGCSATASQPGVNVFHPEIITEYVSQCNPVEVQFSTISEGFVSWEWSFGDGANGSGSSTSHTYLSNGLFEVQLIATNTDNCIDTVLLPQPILVSGPVSAFSSPTPANCAPSVVEFIDESQDAVAWLWDFGDNTSSTEQLPTKLYEHPGVYTISLIVTGADGCTDTLVRPNYVTVLGPATTFTASLSNACLGNSVQFTDLSNGAYEWEWNFGEGTVSNEQNPSFTYEQVGAYVVTLFSLDTLGCSAFYTIDLPIQVHPVPLASFDLPLTSACAPVVIEPMNTSEGGSSFIWQVAPGLESTEASPLITFENAGEYAIQLITTNQFGCSDTSTVQSFEALLVPVAGFTLLQSEGCTPLSVSFQNTSYQTQEASYDWSLGDGASSSETQPTHVYYDPGFFDVALTVTNANGCADTLEISSLVHVFDTLPAPVCPIVRVSVQSPERIIIEWEQSQAPDFGMYRLFRKNPHTLVEELVTEITNSQILFWEDAGLNTMDFVYCYKLQTLDRCGYMFETDSLIEHCSINVEVETLLDNTVDVEWSPYVGKTVAQYRVFRIELPGNEQIDLGTVPGTQTRYNDTTLFCPLLYRYDIRAEGLNGQFHVSSDSDFDVCEPIANLFSEQKVDASRSTVVQNQAILTEWGTPVIMGHRVREYKIYRSTDNELFTLIATVPNFQTSYLDEEVNVQAIKYYYKIEATNDCGLEGIEGDYSDNIVLKAEGDSTFRYNLEWTPYTGWGTNGVGFYIVEKQEEDGTWKIVKQVPGHVTTVVDEN